MATSEKQGITAVKKEKSPVFFEVKPEVVAVVVAVGGVVETVTLTQKQKQLKLKVLSFL